MPPNTVAIGDPVRVFSPDDKEALAKAVRETGFARGAFDIDVRGKDRAAICGEAAEVRAEEFKHHFKDSMIK